jgi:hypothetical protein
MRLKWVGHANLFALIDIGRALHAVQHHRQHFRRRYAVFAFVAKARHDARLIVVTPEQRVPRLLCIPAASGGTAFSAPRSPGFASVHFSPPG